MFSNKKGRMMRHPYASLALLSLATVGAITISRRTKDFFRGKTRCITNMVKGGRMEEI